MKEKHFKQNNQNSGNGITFEQIHISSYQESRWLEHLCKYLVLYFGAIGAVCSFTSDFTINVEESWIFLGVLVLCLIGYLTFAVGRITQYMLTGFIAVMVVAGVLLLDVLGMSLNTIVNTISGKVVFEAEAAPEIFILYIGAIFTMILAYVIIKCKSVLGSAVLTLIPLFAGMFFSRIPDTVSVVAILLHIVSMAALMGAHIQYEKRLNGVALTNMIVLALVCAFVVLVVPEQSYKRLPVFDQLRRHLDGIYYANIEPGVSMLTEHTAVTGVDSGKLGQFDSVDSTGKTMLTLESGYQGNNYLKAFTGAVYADNSWNPLEEAVLAPYNGMFEDFAARGIDVYNQSATVMTIFDNSRQLMMELCGNTQNYAQHVLKRKYAVRYNGVDGKYWYMPYGSQFYVREKNTSDGYPMNNDTGYISSYSYLLSGVDLGRFTEIVDSYADSYYPMQQYQQWEGRYRAFVKAVYTDAGDSFAQIVPEELKTEPLNSYAQVLEYADRMSAYFKGNFHYTKSPGRVPEGRDFAEYFLNDSKEGYCTYFATAATLLLRNAGVPARYVEGYITNVNDSNYTEMVPESEVRSSREFNYTDRYNYYTVEIQDSQAHAWTEIYVDGYGWIPLEFTPGYEEINPLANVPSGPDAVESTEEWNQNTADMIADAMEEADAQENANDAGFDSVEEYMESNKIHRVDFAILLPLLFKQFLRMMRYVALAALCLLAAAIAFYVPAGVVQKRNDRLFMRHEEYTPEEVKQQVVNIYQYIEKLGRFLGVRREAAESYQKYAQRLCRTRDYFAECDVDAIVVPVLKICFGRGNIGNAEMEAVLQSVTEIRKKSYAQLEKKDKLVYRFWYHLY